LRFLIGKAESKGTESSAYKDARKLIRDNYGIMDSEQNELNTTYNEICRTIKEEATEGESPGYWGALSDP